MPKERILGLKSFQRNGNTHTKKNKKHVGIVRLGVKGWITRHFQAPGLFGEEMSTQKTRTHPQWALQRRSALYDHEPSLNFTWARQNRAPTVPAGWSVQDLPDWSNDWNCRNYLSSLETVQIPGPQHRLTKSESWGKGLECQVFAECPWWPLQLGTFGEHSRTAEVASGRETGRRRLVFLDSPKDTQTTTTIVFTSRIRCKARQY